MKIWRFSSLGSVFTARNHSSSTSGGASVRSGESAGLSSQSADGGSSSIHASKPQLACFLRNERDRIKLAPFFRISFHLHAEPRKGEKTRENYKFWRVCRTGGRKRWQSRWKQPWLSWFSPWQVSKPLKSPHLKHLKKDRSVHDALSLSWNTIWSQRASA